jgi:prevent-host-death family protein
VKTLPLSEAKARLSGLVNELELTEEEIVITKNGRAAAVLVSPHEYESWKETLEIRGDVRMMRDIKAGLKSLRKGRAKTYASLGAFLRDDA